MTQPKKKSIVEPSTGLADCNPLVPVFEDMELKSIGLIRVPNKNTFCPYVITSKGDKILKIEIEEPNLRVIAEDCAKINFVNLFCNDGEGT